MSQVRKFQDGGQTEPVKRKVPGADPVVIEQTPVEETVTTPKSYIIIDGEKFENTEEERQKLRDYFARVADARGGSQVLSQIADLAEKAAEEGGSLTYDTPSNLFSYKDSAGVDQKIDWNNLNDRQDDRLQKQRSWLGRVFDANFNSKVQQSAEDISKLAGYRNFRRGQTQAAAATPASNLIDILYGDWWDYLQDDKGFVKDENGNLKYDYNSTKNVKLQKQIQNALAALGMTADEAGKHFKWGEGYNDGADLRSLYEADPEGYKARLQATLDNVVAGRKMTAEDLSILKAFGIAPESSKEGQTLTEAQKKAAEEQALRDKWTKAGFTDIYDKAKDYFDVDDDGVVTLNDNGVATFTPYGFSKTGGYELNDAWMDWVKNEGLDNTLYDFLNGYTVYNGKLYKTSSASDPNSALANIYRTSGYYDKNKANLYADAQKIINSFWGKKYNWDKYDEMKYSDFLWDNAANNGLGAERGYRYRSANGMFTGLEPGQQIVSYYAPDAHRNAAGFVTDDSILYDITDQWGNVKVKGLTKDKLAEMGIKAATRADGSEIKYGDAENTEFKQRELKYSTDRRINGHYLISYGENDAWGVYRNPKRVPNLNDPSSLDVYIDPEFGGGFVVPPALSKLLFRENGAGGTIMDSLISNPKLLEKFKKILKEFGRTRGAEGPWRNLGVGLLTFKEMLRPLGCSEQEIQSAFNDWETMIKDPNRATKYVVATPRDGGQQVQSQKQGGTIRKFQPGGGFGSTAGSKGVQERGTRKVTDTRKSAEYGFKAGWSWDKLTSADKWDLVGLGMDLAAIAAGAAPIAGGVVGMGGTAAGLVADIRRDGFQMRDLGNAGISLAGDLLSFLPGAGSGIQAAKLATKIKKFAKPLMQIMSMYGAVSAAPLVGKLMKNGSLTAQEWRQLAAGAAGAINSAKTGRPFAKTTKKGDAFADINIKGQKKTVDLGEGLTVKPKDGVDAPNITLTKAQIDEINAITDPLHRAARARDLAWQSYKANWDPAKGPIGKRSDFFKSYDFAPYFKTTSAKLNPNDGDTFVIKNTKDADKNIVLSKDEIDRINAAADPSAEFDLVLNGKFKADPKFVKYDSDKTPSFTKNIKDDYGDISYKALHTPSKYTTPDLKTNGHLISKKNNADIDLQDADIKRIIEKENPVDQQAEFIKVIQEKSGNTSLDTIDKIKDEYEGIDNFFTKKRGEFEWRHPIESTKKKSTFDLESKAEKEIINRPVHGNGWRGVFGARDWFNGQGTTLIRGVKRDAFLDPDAILRSHRAVGATGTFKTKTGTNWWAGQRQISRKTNAPIVMHLGNANPYEDDPSFRLHLAQRKYNDDIPVWGYEPDAEPGVSASDTRFTDENGNVIEWKKQGGQIQKYGSGGQTNEPTVKKIGQKLEKVDPADLLEFSKYLVNVSNSNKLNRLAKKAYDNVPMKIATQYSVPTFSDNGLLNAGNEAVKEIYNRQPANYTSDAMLNNFVRKANQEKATEYKNKLNTQFATMLNQHNQKMWEIENKNNESRTATANENNQQRWKTELAKNQMDQATLSANNQSFDNLITDRITKLAAKKAAANAAKEKMAGVYNNAEMYKELMNDGRYKQAMDAWNTYHAANPTKTQDEWFAGEGKSYAAGYEQALKQAQTKLGLNVYSTSFEDFGPYARGVDQYRSQLYDNALKAGLINPDVKTFKKGGKTSEYKAYRDTRDQLWIDQNKAVRQAINQLNKSTQQILLKMLK